MNTNVILSKDSNPSDIECYFRGVLALDQQEKVFSVNLDDVWQLVYSEKSKAVRALKANFIENVDFIVIAQNGKNSLAQNGKQDWGGNNKVDYYLTSACLEYFIARKVRPVFEVYRRVFHHVANKTLQPQQTLWEQVKMKLEFADWSAKFLNLNAASRLLMARRIGETVGMQDTLPTAIDAGTQHPVTQTATELLRRHNIKISTVAFNRILERKGIVRKASRPSNVKGKTHNWMVLLPDFDKYGENQQDPKHQKQTQIRWYENSFGDIIAKAGLATQATMGL